MRLSTNYHNSYPQRKGSVQVFLACVFLLSTPLLLIIMATTHDLKLKPLTALEARNGANVIHKFTWKELKDNSVAGESISTSHLYYMIPLLTGTFVRGVYVHINEKFTHPGAFMVMTVGDLNDVDGFITSTSLSGAISSQDYAVSNNGAYFTSTDTTSSNGETDDVTVSLSSTVNDKKYSNANSQSATTYLAVTFTPVGFALNELTAGAVTVMADVVTSPGPFVA